MRSWLRAEDEATQLRAEAVELRAEIERLQAALTLIDNMEPATHEMTLAHQMAQIAREALSSE